VVTTVGSSPERVGETHRARAPGSGFVPRGWIAAFAVVGVVLAAVALYSLWSFWPASSRVGTSAAKVTAQRVNYFGWRPSLSPEFLLFVVVAIAGALGGLVHTIRSFSWYVGNRRLHWSWVPFYSMLPAIGALGATVFYLVLRAGLFSPSASTEQISPFGFTAVAVLVGLFSEQALEKLRQVASNLFAERPTGADHVEPESTGSQAARNPPG
jgi:hypothetical protein